jgi:hypothetical protein
MYLVTWYAPGLLEWTTVVDHKTYAYPKPISALYPIKVVISFCTKKQGE